MQRMVSWNKVFVDHSKGTILAGVLSLHESPHCCPMTIAHVLVTILAQHALDFKSTICHD